MEVTGSDPPHGLATLASPVSLPKLSRRMSSGTNSNPEDSTDTERATLLTALSGMTAAQMIELRTTARRFQHLPFPRLVRALFEQDAVSDEGDGLELGSDSQPRKEPIFADNAGVSRRSRFMDELFTQIERALASKTTGD